MVAGQHLFSMFEAALGMVAPWQVTSVDFDKDAGEQQIGLGFRGGSRFPCPVQGCRQSACVVHDTLDKRLLGCHRRRDGRDVGSPWPGLRVDLHGPGPAHAKRCRLEPVKEFVRMVEAHWEGIIAWQESRLSNGYWRKPTPWSRQPNAGLEATDPRTR